MVHREGGRGRGGEEERVCARLLCHAHLHLAVNGLETGYSKDIHGEVLRSLQMYLVIGLVFKTRRGSGDISIFRESRDSQGYLISSDYC